MYFEIENGEARMLLEVTIRLDKNGVASFEFYEPESGDFSRIEYTTDKHRRTRDALGMELLSWIDIMRDRMDAAE